MKYGWKAIYRRVDVKPTADGEVENYQTIKKSGVINETQAGQNVVQALLNWDVGNLVYLEVVQIED